MPLRDSSVRRKRTNGQEPRAVQRWTREEDAFIKRHCEAMTDAAMATALGRSRDATSVRRRQITPFLRGTSPQRWTAEDNAMLVALYGKVDTLFLAAVLDRPVRQLRSHVFEVRLPVDRNLWSSEEDAILRRHFPYAPVTLFAELLPGRGLKTIYGRANKLALSRDPSYMLRSAKQRWFHAYPPDLQSLIHLFNQVERRLRDVQAKH